MNEIASIVDSATDDVILARQHLVRFGALGHVGHFTSVDAVRYPRDMRVVIRTSRGLELGQVLAEPQGGSQQPSDGSILRGLTAEDQLLAARQDQNRLAALEDCAARLAAMNSAAVLVDVEHLFDGQSLVFHFLGEVTPEIEALTAQLAEVYEARVQFRKFTDAVNEGCGPGCGTDVAAGCKTCVSGCAIAAACPTKAHHAG